MLVLVPTANGDILLNPDAISSVIPGGGRLERSFIRMTNGDQYIYEGSLHSLAATVELLRLVF